MWYNEDYWLQGTWIVWFKGEDQRVLIKKATWGLFGQKVFQIYVK